MTLRLWIKKLKVRLTACSISAIVNGKENVKTVFFKLMSRRDFAI